MQHGNTALHEAARWRHPSTVQLLMHSDCRINMRNAQGETPMEIARREGYNEVIAQLSGLGNCNLQDTCGCSELRKLLFQNKETLKTDDLQKIKLSCQEGESIADQLEEKIRRTSESRVLQMEHSWQERLELARTELLAQCESRIAEVEQQCKVKVAQIERQCSERLQAARAVLADVMQAERAPSAPGSFRRPSFSSSSSIIDFQFRANSL